MLISYGSGSDGSDSDDDVKGIGNRPPQERAPSLLGASYTDDDDSDDEGPLLLGGAVGQGEIILDNDDVAESGEKKDSTTGQYGLSVEQQSQLLNSEVWGFRFLPPMATGSPSEKVQENIRRGLQETKKGLSFNQQLQSQVKFQNPSYFQSLANQYRINTIGTNFEPSVFPITKADNYLTLSAQQKIREDIQAEKRRQREAIQFKDGGLLPKKKVFSGASAKASSRWGATGAPALKRMGSNKR